ncbi:permease [Sphingomonas sp. CGMCC 1.13654]|uniref:Permease n=1 Tax=Sphingomonas chungangi TaxID=2683589 RepID=A0A838LCI1_9SPHN|nr:permease [Sphingomonas chungangi]MBA2935188.1 permease [Sphingomonas chungangi]MVW55266.1 permease [Sphingomonas chungangi]
MPSLLHLFLTGLLIAAGMAWKTGWSLVLGFAISAVLQVIVSADRLRDLLGTDRAKSIAIASAAGAASSSCSYASASIMRTLFKKGAALGPSLAFLVASTNLVLELGVILWLLMGWRFMVAEWVGGTILIILMVPIVRLAIPRSLIDAARVHEETGQGHDHGGMKLEGGNWRERLRNPKALGMIAQAFVMEWKMLWKDLLAGFLIGGVLAAFVPDGFWQGLFLAGAPDWIRIPADVLIGPIVAMLTFVCSIGNVPLAAMLWGGGASFGGVIAFLYADLIVLPLIDAYRRYFGWRMALAIAAVLFVSMAGAALIVSLGFGLLGLTPAPMGGIRAAMTDFSFDYSFWLDCLALLLASWLFVLARRQPAGDHHHCH